MSYSKSKDFWFKFKSPLSCSQYRRSVPRNSAIALLVSMTQDLHAGVAAIAELVLTGAVLVLGREWKGYRRGAATRPAVAMAAGVTSFILCLCTLWNVGLALYRLVREPAAMGNKDELGIIAAGVATLWYTDVMRLRKRVKRRRNVAVLLAQFPTFRFGKSGYNTPLPDNCRNAEIVIRSAHWGLRKQSQKKYKEYWRGSVSFSIDEPQWGSGTGGGIVVLHDPEAQDEAGSELLGPMFTHAPELSKQFVADTIWSAVGRSQIWALFSWDTGFGQGCSDVLKEVHGIDGMRKGELWRQLCNQDSAVSVQHDVRVGHGAPMPEADVSELRELLWAALTLEALEHIGTGKKMVLLTSIVKMPLDVKDATWSPSDVMKTACKAWKDLRIAPRP
jgi:hypothetical protein